MSNRSNSVIVYLMGPKGRLSANQTWIFKSLRGQGLGRNQKAASAGSDVGVGG